MNNPFDSKTEDGGVSLAEIARVLRKRRWMMLGILLAIPLATGFVVHKQPKVYQAQTSIVIDSSVPQYLGQSFRDVVDLESAWWSAQESLQTELRVLKSWSQALAVAKALCDKQLGGEPALRRLRPGIDCQSPSELAALAPLLQAMLVIEPVKDSRVVLLSVSHGDPQMAALFANTEAQIYAERNLERRLSQSEGAANWLGDEYGDLTAQLNASERALIEFKKKNNVVAVAIEDQQNDLSTRRKKLADELSSVQIKLIGLRAQLDECARLKSNDPLSDASPGIADNPTVAKVRDLYIGEYGKLLELRGRYLDKHPAITAQEQRVQVLRDELRNAALLAGKSIEAQYNTILKQERDLKTALDVTTHEALQLEARAIEYNRLKRNFDRLSKLSEQVGGRERETSLAGHLKTNNVRVLDAALVPTAAISPNVPRSVGISVLVAIVVALGLAFLLEILDVTVKSQEDVERAAGAPFLGLIPRILPETRSDAPTAAPPKAVAGLVRGGSRDLYVLGHPKSSVAECCRAIRTNLLFMSPDRPAKSLLVTSAGPEEGKTTSAINLAITMAQSGLRVLLVDSDMRRPRMHKAFGIPATADGLSKAILGEANPFEMVRESGVTNLSLLPCGPTPPNPAELLHAERFRRIVDQMVGAYDRVIFDSPPVGAVTDGAILARITDGTVLVAKGGRTKRDALARARRALSMDGRINILGCILNDLDLSKQSSYGYYYYSRYGYYYRDNEETAALKESANG
jgi:capsular exopolysaccharide synthesis family protein